MCVCVAQASQFVEVCTTDPVLKRLVEHDFVYQFIVQDDKVILPPPRLPSFPPAFIPKKLTAAKKEDSCCVASPAALRASRPASWWPMLLSIASATWPTAPAVAFANSKGDATASKPSLLPSSPPPYIVKSGR